VRVVADGKAAGGRSGRVARKALKDEAETGKEDGLLSGGGQEQTR